MDNNNQQLTDDISADLDRLADELKQKGSDFGAQNREMAKKIDQGIDDLNKGFDEMAKGVAEAENEAGEALDKATEKFLAE